MADTSGTKTSFFQVKFDNICLILLIVMLVSLLTWADKHNNGDFVKWLEVFTAGIGGSYLTRLQDARQAWQKNGNGAPNPPSPTSTEGQQSDK